MQNKKPWLYLAAVALVLLALKYSDALFGGIRLFFSLLMPLLLGCGVAYVLNILVSRLETLPPLRDARSRLYPARRAISITGALVIIAVVAALLVVLIIPQLVDAFRVMLVNVPPAVNAFLNWLDSLDIDMPQLENWLRSLNLNWPELLQKATTYLTSGVGNVFSSAFALLSSLGGILMQVVIAVIFALYLLAGKERLGRQFRALADTYLPASFCDRLWYVLATAHDTFTKFFVGQFTEAIIIGVLCTLGMLLFRLPYAPMIGTLVGATALLPVVGAYLGAGHRRLHDPHRQPAAGGGLSRLHRGAPAAGRQPDLPPGGGHLHRAARHLGAHRRNLGRRHRRHRGHAAGGARHRHPLPPGAGRCAAQTHSPFLISVPPAVFAGGIFLPLVFGAPLC